MVKTKENIGKQYLVPPATSVLPGVITTSEFKPKDPCGSSPPFMYNDLVVRSLGSQVNVGQHNDPVFRIRVSSNTHECTCTCMHAV